MDTLQIEINDWEILQENKIIVDAWIAGLRSGKWIQIIGAMTNLTIPNSACCLMVLEAECNNKIINDYISVYAHDPNTFNIAGLPTEEANALQFKLQGRDFKYPQSITAKFTCNSDIEHLKKWNNALLVPSQWNDTLKLSFEEIATLLETGSLNKDFSIKQEEKTSEN